MLSEKNKTFYKKKENKYNNFNSNEGKNYKKYKTKTDHLQYNNNGKNKNSKVFINLDPENLEKNYKKGEKNYPQEFRDKTKTYIQSNNHYQTNANISENEAFFLGQQKDNFSSKKNNTNYFNYINNKVDNENRKINSNNDHNDYRNVSPIKKYIEKKNFMLYLNKGIMVQKDNNDNNNKAINEKKFINKTFDYNKVGNNRYNPISLNDNFNISQTQTDRDKARFTIIQKKIITIFVQIISRIIEKHKKKDKKEKEQKNTEIKNTNMSTYHSVSSKTWFKICPCFILRKRNNR